jgi:broad specificity phosphatase PhoE
VRELLLTRHAESEFNASGRVNADPRIPCALTDRGEGQAAALHELLAGEPIDLCVTSEHQRALQTADIALAGRGIPRLVVSDLNEPLAGALEGGTASAYDERLTREGPSSPNPGGESQLDALRRYVHAYRTLARRDESTILIVAHSLPIGWLRSAAAAINGSDDALGVDFAKPGIDFAGAPDRYSSRGLARAVAVLERYLDPR